MYDQAMKTKKSKLKPTQIRIGAPARRALILHEASEIFTREGIENTSMRKIAAKAGVTAALLYKHFADKDELLMAIGEEFFLLLAHYMDKALGNATEPLDQLKRQMRAYVTCGIENPRAYHLTFMTALPRLRRGQELRAYRARTRRGEHIPPSELTNGIKCFGRLENAVAAVVKTNVTRTKDIAALSEVVWANGHGLVSLVITHADFGFSSTKKLIDLSIETTLFGLLHDGS